MIDLKEVVTVSEAAEIYNIDVSTLRKLVKTDKLTENVDFRKSKATWLFVKDSLDKIYLNKKKN